MQNKIEEIKNALRNIIRKHKSFDAARKCKYCNERINLIEKWAWE